MANILSLVDEFEDIATAQQGLESFIYGDLHQVNSFRNKTYPLLLVERKVHIEGWNLKNRQRIYHFRIHFMTPYSRQSEAQTDSEEQQYDLELIAGNFLQEFRTRYKLQAKPWKVFNDEALKGTWSFNRYNDRLVQLSYQMQVLVQGSCVTGSFNYN